MNFFHNFYLLKKKNYVTLCFCFFLPAVIQEQLSMIDDKDLEYLKNTPLGTAERSLITAQLFGDVSEVDFWTVALYYLQVTKLETKNR